MTEPFFPRNYLASGWNIGIKDGTLDFGVIHSLQPATAAAVFTRNNFPGNPVIVGREHVANGRLQTIVVNSKNANVATGEAGLQLARDMCRWTAEAFGIHPELVLPSSTGVIGRMPPAEKLKDACRSIPDHLKGPDFPLFAEAIMTTDTRKKIQSQQLRSGIRITAVAKGAGMIEPNMATMLSYLATDARMDIADLKRLIRSIANRTFNRVSVDSDTSTSDTFVMLANGASGIGVSFPPETAEAFDRLKDPFQDGILETLPSLNDESLAFLAGVANICRDLAREIARDGEGATRLIELTVDEAKNRDQALKIARSVINSPLVKTAIYGADPNWGRILMAVGKVFDEPVPIQGLRIYFGDLVLNDAGPDMLSRLSGYLKNSEVKIRISLGLGEAAENVWGCDFTEDYIRINAHYTT